MHSVSAIDIANTNTNIKPGERVTMISNVILEM
jgi:hypothetical protein